MLTTIKGRYHQGQIELLEPPLDIQDNTPVIITFLSDSTIDLRQLGFTQAQIAELRVSLTTFVDWETPEMDVYNDYDTAKANL